MDEPTAGMAPKERIALMELTARLAREREYRGAVHRTRHGMSSSRTADASSCSPRPPESPRVRRRPVRANAAVQESISLGAMYGGP